MRAGKYYVSFTTKQVPPTSGISGVKPSRWKEKLRKVVGAVEPATRIAERVAQLAVHVQKPSIAGTVGLAASACNAAREYLEVFNSPSWTNEMLISRGYMVEAFRSVGAAVKEEKHGDGSVRTQIDVVGERFTVHADGSLTFSSPWSKELGEFVAQAVDRVLPQAVRIYRTNEGNVSVPLELSGLRSKQGPRIVESTVPLLAGGRCILLEGRPGVGKTTMAQEVARLSDLGRVVLLDATVIGGRSDRDDFAISPSTAGNAQALSLLSAGVIIVDDVDKCALPLWVLEAIRSACRLVILTANNGKHDSVLDGALMRAGRVDEVFTISPEHSERRAPFDRLDDATWEEVRDWPVAYLNEIEKRIAHRPGDLRIDDLRDRIGRRVRSGAELC